MNILFFFEQAMRPEGKTKKPIGKVPRLTEEDLQFLSLGGMEWHKVHLRALRKMQSKAP